MFKEHRIFDLYFHQIDKFMYLFTRGLLPNYFRDMFTLASQLHSHYTRNCNYYYIPPGRTNIRNFSIRFQGPTFFNSLSLETVKASFFFLSQIDSLLSYILLSFPFLFSFFKIIHFNISCCPNIFRKGTP